MSTSRTALVGAFVTGGLLLFAAGLFMIGDRRLLFAEHFEAVTTFGKVTGLEVGTRVRVAGLDAGEVLEIGLPRVPSEQFRIRMRLREDLRPLVRTDSVCGIQTDGIVGSAFIQISVGTDQAPVVASGGTIPGSDPIEFGDLIKEGRDTFRTLSSEVMSLTGDVSATIATLRQTSESVNTMLQDVNADLKTMATSGTRAIDEIRLTMTDARGVVADVREGRGTVGRLLTDDTLYQRMTGLASEAEKTMANMQAVSARARTTVDSVTAQDGPVQVILSTLRDTAADAREVMADLSEGTEALKRNFLVRGFFRDRGFYDLDTVSRDTYVGGALEANDRTALRVWIDAAGLFARAPDDTLQLTAAGRRRLDSAMADLVRYPRDSPLVVEGYSDASDGGSPYLISTDRATLVRDYLLTRFSRKATLTGVMSLGTDAPGSPRGDNRWSGVALSLFVRHDALTR
ncbi:MAG: MlaD family protein [Acidobacteriota bacterium]